RQKCEGRGKSPRHSQGDFVSVQQAGSKMIPREVFNYAAPRCAAHSLNDLRISVQMLECRCNRVNVSRFDDDSLHVLAHHIACLPGSDLRQRARGRLIGHFGAALPLRWKNVDGALAEITLRIADKTYDANIIAPELLQIRLRFVMHGTDQPQLGVW